MKKNYLGFFFFIISIFVHNSFIIFSPLLILMINNKLTNFISYSLVLFFAIIISVVMQIDNDFISRGSSLEIEIGENIAQFIFYVLILIVILYHMINSKVKFENKIFKNFLILISCIYLIFMINLNSLSSFRLSLSIFFLILPYIILITENSFKQKILSRIILFHLSLIPLFIL